jgi:hypothetical protein
MAENGGYQVSEVLIYIHYENMSVQSSEKQFCFVHDLTDKL